MDSDQIQRNRKKFILGLPVWDQVKELRTELDKLAYDVDKYLSAINENSRKLVSIPKFDPKCEKKVKEESPRDLDIVKLYSINEGGECTIIQDKDIWSEGLRVYKDSTVGDSIDLLEKRLEYNDPMYVMDKPGQPWKRCRVRSVMHTRVNGRPSTAIKLITDAKSGSRVIKAKKFAVARAQNHGDKLRSSKRVIAGISNDDMMPGIIGQDPAEFNHHRYLVFFDHGGARYFNQDQVYPICYQTGTPWKDYRFLEERNNPNLECELTQLFLLWPRRNILQAKPGLEIVIERNGMRVAAKIISIDDDVMQIVYKDGTEEYLYRGTMRLSRVDSMKCKLLASNFVVNFNKLHNRLVGHIKRYKDCGVKAIGEEYLKFLENLDEPIVVASATARKSTSRLKSPPRTKIKLNEERVADDRISRPDLEGLKSGPRNHPRCTPDCILIVGEADTEACVKDLVEQFKDYSDLKVPLKLGWRRILANNKDKRTKSVCVYEAPCGRILTSYVNIKNYIKQTQSAFDVDYFTFEREIDLNSPATEFEPRYYEDNIAKSLEGLRLERKTISLMNPFDEERLPRDFEYRNETFPHPMLKAKGFVFNPEFKSGCDCEDDCSSRSSCKCHQLNEEAAGTNAHNRGTVDNKCQYTHKRLPQQVSTGIFECNEFCSCSSRCPNRVVQNGIRVRIQVRKTVSKGWGVFALDDIPAGAFVCTYSAELLDDADQYGADDMYFADLDYVAVVEEAKLDLDNVDDKSDEGVVSEEETISDSISEHSEHSEPIRNQSNKRDRSRSSSPVEFGNFLPRYPRRNRTGGNQNTNGTANAKTRRPKRVYKPIMELLGEKEDTYTLDARMQGNIGRFFNHSCDPNTFVQNVFINTHDLRIPNVAFFAKRRIKAEDEITWNYNYKIDSIAGRQILCNCNAPNCKGRIL